MKKFLFLSTLAIVLFSLTIWITACQKEPATPEQTATSDEISDRSQGDSKVFPVNAHPYGNSYAEWAKIWLQQFMTYDCDHVPWVHPESVLFYQSGPVYMLAGIADEGSSANISVPHGKALFFPLVNFWWDLCPDELPPGMTPVEYLVPNVQGLMDLVDVSSLSVTVDGSPVSNVSTYNFMTGVFDLTANPELADCFDPCVVGGGPTPTVTAGYYIMLKPLSKGVHTVHYHSAIPSWETAQDATYNITVE